MYSISCPILYPIQSKPQTKLNQFLVETLRTVFRILHTLHKLSISAYDVLLLITSNLLLLVITLLLYGTLHLTFQPSRFCCFASPVILNPSPCPVLSCPLQTRTITTHFSNTWVTSQKKNTSGLKLRLKPQKRREVHSSRIRFRFRVRFG